MQEDKQIIFSGAQPSGQFTIGNYLGAINNWRKLQEDYNCLYCIVDMHAITIRHNPAVLRKQIRDALIQYIALGLDPKQSILYVQSHVPAHAELAWVLGSFTYMGELSRMTQFKDKASKHTDNINAGLLTYPVLMAADILLYQANYVPVGEDQRQHLELTRDIANRMNNLYEGLFTVPEPLIYTAGAKIMSLQEPEHKMSKSDENPNNVIYLMDDAAVILNKVKRAVTDSDSQVRAAADKPGVTNLLTIYSCITGKSIAQSEKEFDGFGYGKFKEAVGETVVSALLPVQKRVIELSKEKAYIDEVMKSNAEKAAYLANKTLRKVYKKIGFVPRG